MNMMRRSKLCLCSRSVLLGFVWLEVSTSIARHRDVYPLLQCAFTAHGAMRSVQMLHLRCNIISRNAWVSVAVIKAVTSIELLGEQRQPVRAVGAEQSIASASATLCRYPRVPVVDIHTGTPTEPNICSQSGSRSP